MKRYLLLTALAGLVVGVGIVIMLWLRGTPEGGGEGGGGVQGPHTTLVTVRIDGARPDQIVRLYYADSTLGEWRGEQHLTFELPVREGLPAEIRALLAEADTESSIEPKARAVGSDSILVFTVLARATPIESFSYKVTVEEERTQGAGGKPIDRAALTTVPAGLASGATDGRGRADLIIRAARGTSFTIVATKGETSRSSERLTTGGQPTNVMITFPAAEPARLVERSYLVQVSDAGRPVGNARIQVSPRDLAAGRATNPGGSAEVLVRGAKDARFRIMASVGDREKSTDMLSLVAGAQETIRIELPSIKLATGTYTVRVRRETKGVEGAKVRITGEGVAEERTTDGQGIATFSLTGEKNVRLEVSAEAPDGAKKSASGTYRLTDGAKEEITIDLPMIQVQREYSIEVQRAGEPVQGASVATVPGDLAATVRTDASGKAKLAVRGRPGELFEIKARAADGAEGTTSGYELKEGPPVSVKIDIPPREAAVITINHRVKVTRAGRPVKSADVEVLPGGERGQTDASGLATIGVRLQAGAALKFIASSEGSTASKEVTQPDKSTTTPLVIDLPALVTVIPITYRFEATRAEGSSTAALAGVEVTLAEKDTGTKLGAAVTGQDGRASITASAREGASLVYDMLWPGRTSQCTATGDTGEIAHRSDGSTIFAQWKCASASRSRRTDSEWQSLVVAAMDDAWNIAFRLLVLPVNDRGVTRGELSSRYSEMDRKIEDMRADAGAPERDRDILLLQMLAAASSGDVASFSRYKAEFDGLENGLRAPVLPAVFLYDALARTIRGVADRDETVEALRGVDRTITSASTFIKSQIRGRQYGVGAALYWEMANHWPPIDDPPPMECQQQAETKINLYLNHCAENPGCRGSAEHEIIKGMKAAIQGKVKQIGEKD